MAGVIRRRYLGGAAAALGGLLAAACGEIEVRYVQGPAGPAGAQGGRGAAGAAGATGATGTSGAAGQTQVVVQEKVVTVEKVVEKVVVQEKTPVKITYLNSHFPGTVNYEWDFLVYNRMSEEYPHIVFEHSPIKTSRKEAFIVRASAGVPAHMVQNDWGVWLDLARGGGILELTDLFKREKITPTETFLRWSVEQYSYAGRMFGFPLSQSSDSFPYNKGLFDRAGLPHPPTDVEDQTWTMEAYLETLQKLKQALGEDDIAMGNGHGYHWNRGTWYGHSSWDDVAVKPTMDHELFIQGNQFWQDLKHKHRLIADSESLEAVGGIGKGFPAGKVAMYYTCCPHNVLRDAKATGVEAGLATLPFSGWDTNGNTLFPGKNISGRVWPHNMHVAKEITTEEQEGAWTFFMWLLKDPKNGGLMPPSNQHIVAPYLDETYSEAAQKDFEAITGVDSVASSAPLQNALTEYPSFCGMLKYEEYSDAWNTIKDEWTKHEANEMSSRDFSARAQEVFLNAKLGTNTL